MKKTYDLRYTSGQKANMGDKVRTMDSREDCFLRVVGRKKDDTPTGYVTVYHHSWPQARVYHISEIEQRED